MIRFLTKHDSLLFEYWYTDNEDLKGMIEVMKRPYLRQYKEKTNEELIALLLAGNKE